MKRSITLKQRKKLMIGYVSSQLMLITLGLAFLISCTPEKIPQEDRQVKIANFVADSAYAFVQQQVNFGERYMNTAAHEACKDWLVAKLANYGLEVSSQVFTAESYEGKTLNGTNIIGRYNPLVRERLLLCAHYDTRHIADKDTIDQGNPILGADDGASGVGVILEIARQLQLNPIPMGVDIVFLDSEDYGSDQPGEDYTWALGAQYWSKNLPDDPYEVQYGILLDMVGAKGATFPKEGFSMQTAANEVDKIWKLGQQMNYGQFFQNYRVGGYTDDHRFIIENTNIPMIDVINVKEDGKFGFHHHTHADDMDIIDKATLKAVGQVVLATVYKESNKEAF